ncbi:Kinesin-like [Zostera marina]|uniref:Kinesin-like n=1 Tax=Zostera marina TaxID=29655 RepID=A0A0K9PGL0_ZOSMR|nr:Kinesin-like [Zostera marina]
MVRRTGGGSRRTAKKIASPIISPISGESSPIPLKFTKSFDFDFDSLTSSLKDKKKKTIVASSPLLRPTNVPTPDGTPVTIEGLRELVSSRTDTVKRSLDVCHSETLKEFESSTMRITKRFKIHSQSCAQLCDEVDIEYKKISDRIIENTDLLKSSYLEIIKDAQASASRVCKVSIPELAQSFENAIEALHNRYKI